MTGNSAVTRARSRAWARLPGLALLAITACGGGGGGNSSGSTSTSGSEDSSKSGACSGSRALPISVLDDDSRVGIPSPLVAIELGGLTEAAPSPVGSYTLGGQGDTAGTYASTLACGRFGVHLFANGYRCTSIDTSNSGALTLGLTANTEADALPTVDSAAWDILTPKPASMATLTVTTTAADAAAPVAQVLAVEPVTHRAVALNLVAGGQGTAQTWQAQVRMPGQPGDYTYVVVAATAACEASKLVRLPLSVR